MNNFIEGKYVNLRDVELEDAAFILSLRTDPKKSQFLHATSSDLKKQEDYIRRYKANGKEWYFIIMDKANASIGTIRIYDVRGDDFCPGSWLIVDGMSPLVALDSFFLMYDYAFYTLGFSKAHFDVRKGNTRVQRFHKMFGAVKTGESDIDYFYAYDRETYEQNKEVLKATFGYGQ